MTASHPKDPASTEGDNLRKHIAAVCALVDPLGLAEVLDCALGESMLGDCLHPVIVAAREYATGLEERRCRAGVGHRCPEEFCDACEDDE